MSSEPIERWRGDAEGRSRTSAFRDLVFTVATAEAVGPSLAAQTARSLEIVDRNLAEAGSDKTRLLSATVYLTDIAGKAEMDAVWCEWVGDEENWPQRACVGANLAGNDLVEIVVTAALL